MSDSAKEKHMEALKAIYKSQEYSDLTVKCGEDSYKVHKAIVCPQSTIFQLACRKGRFKEGQEGIVTIKASAIPDYDEDAEDPEAVKAMVHYFYHFDYLLEERDDLKHLMAYGSYNRYNNQRFAAPNIRFGLHAKIYAMAEKYGIRGLKALALEKFSQAAAFNNSHTYDEFAKATEIIYYSTIAEDKGLRDIVVKTILSTPSLLKHPTMEVVLTQINGLCYDLLVRQTDGNY